MAKYRVIEKNWIQEQLDGTYEMFIGFNIEKEQENLGVFRWVDTGITFKTLKKAKEYIDFQLRGSKVLYISDKGFCDESYK